MKTPSPMQKSRTDRTNKGGHRIDIMLTPKAATKLQRFRARGMKTIDVVNDLLESSRP